MAFSANRMKTEVKKLPHSEIEIRGEVDKEIFEGYRSRAVNELKKEFELPGFRKGKVPENIFLEKVPEMMVLEEMAEIAINEAYPKIVEEHKLDPIGRPEIAITKIAKDNPLGFIIKTALVPEIKLPDYKKIAVSIPKSKESTEATEKEIEDAVNEIRKMRAPKMKPSRDTVSPTKTKDNQSEAESRTEAPNNKSDNSLDTGASGTGIEIPQGGESIQPVLPEFNDEFVKTLGSFKDVAEFKEKLKENIKLEKEQAEKEKRRVKLLDTLVEKTEIDLPKIIIEEEKNKLVYQLRHDVERMGIKFNDYLKNAGKTEDDIKKEWENEAIKRAKIQFLVTEIGIKESITPTEEELSAEMKHLLEHNKGVDESRARIYLSSLLTNQKVLEWLEGQKS